MNHDLHDKEMKSTNEEETTICGWCAGFFIFRIVNSISVALKDCPPTFCSSEKSIMSFPGTPYAKYAFQVHQLYRRISSCGKTAGLVGQLGRLEEFHGQGEIPILK